MTRLRKQAIDFIAGHPAASLATASKDHRPDVATVYCVVNEDMTIYFTTRVEGRKYINMMENPIVALSFADAKIMKSIRLTGNVERVLNAKEIQIVIHKLFMQNEKKQNKQLPSMYMFDEGYANEIAVMRVTPREMTFSDFSVAKGGVKKPIFQKIM